MSPTSLRTRILSGAVLWTIGLFWAGVIISTALMVRYRSYPVILHGTASTHGTLLLVFVAACMVAGLVQVRRAFSPLTELRKQLANVRAGREHQISGRYPAEVQPLVDDLNALLVHRDQAVRRAITKAGDLAHGLKTPLALLTQEAERARASGQVELSTTVSEHVERMRRQIDYHLAHARAAASGATPGATCAVLESAEGLARTLLRLHAARGLDMQVAVNPTHAVRALREDLDEMLGNLLDNACKWTRTTVIVSSSLNGAALVIDVDDDGPGVEPSMWEVILQRGVRVDQAAAGSGLGLAIVRELAELHGGSLTLGRAPAGGLRARLRLPRAMDSRLGILDSD